jgi:tetratricopeptide (TPR) repeat protein
MDLAILLINAGLSLFIGVISCYIYTVLFDKSLRIRYILLISILSILFIFILSYTQIDYKIGPDNEMQNVQAAWNNKGYAFYVQGNYIEAIKCYEEALAIDPEYELAKNNRKEASKKLVLTEQKKRL